MSSYQPGIPTGSISLDLDYVNIQNNFGSLNTQFGIDHIPFSNLTPLISGYHTNIHLNPFSTTATNPPNNWPAVVVPTNTPGYGQLFSAQIYDGLNTDTALYWLTGNDILIQLTRNVQPVPLNNGYTFLPGGLIYQWGKTNAVTNSSSNIILFNIPFPNAVFNVQCTIQTDDNSTIRFSVFDDPAKTGFATTQTNSSHFTKLYWTAIGN